MLSEKYLERYAEVLLWGLAKARKNKIKQGDIVLIRYHLGAVRLTEIIEAKLLRMGLLPVQRLNPTATMEKNFYNISNTEQLTFIPPGEKELYSNLNGAIFLFAPESITHLANVPPKKIGQFTRSRKELRNILDSRDELGHFGWTLCMLPTNELAKHAQLDIDTYSKQVIKACFLDSEDPVAKWQTVFDNAQKIKQWLNGLNVSKYHVESDHIDLYIQPGEKRKWIGLSGHNIPSFEIFLSPDWRGTKGVYYADQPSYRSGNFVKGIRLEFNQGSAVKIEAEVGEAFAKEQFSMDKGANKIGEFSLTDRRFSKIDCFMANTLFDENYGGPYGNCHIALGSSYSDTYNGNPVELTTELKKELGFNDSALHWDLVNTEEKRVTAHLKSGDQILIYENGQFQIAP
ncbi:MAG: aminopeptidase [Desulfobacteraceae bacterium]|jgi:aminopeptidase